MSGAADRPALAMLDGRLVPFADARISVMAPGLTFAATVFEGLRAYWNEESAQLWVFRMPEHLARLRFSMRVMELDPELPGPAFGEQVITLLRASGKQTRWADMRRILAWAD